MANLQGYITVGFLCNAVGLCNAAATFQRLMQTVLQGLYPKQCLIYLDDVIVYGRTAEKK